MEMSILSVKSTIRWQGTISGNFWNFCRSLNDPKGRKGSTFNTLEEKSRDFIALVKKLMGAAFSIRFPGETFKTEEKREVSLQATRYVKIFYC